MNHLDPERSLNAKCYSCYFIDTNIWISQQLTIHFSQDDPCCHRSCGRLRLSDKSEKMEIDNDNYSSCNLTKCYTSPPDVEVQKRLVYECNINSDAVFCFHPSEFLQKVDRMALWGTIEEFRLYYWYAVYVILITVLGLFLFWLVLCCFLIQTKNDVDRIL